MTKPALNNYTQTLYSLADSYALGPNQFLHIVNDLNKDNMQDSINCYYQENGMKFEVMFGTTVGCGAPGFYATQTAFKAYDPDRIYYNNLLKQITAIANFRLCFNFHPFFHSSIKYSLKSL